MLARLSKGILEIMPRKQRWLQFPATNSTCDRRPSRSRRPFCILKQVDIAAQVRRVLRGCIELGRAGGGSADSDDAAAGNRKKAPGAKIPDISRCYCASTGNGLDSARGYQTPTIGLRDRIEPAGSAGTFDFPEAGPGI
jgi:hypothetical protein